MKRAFLVAVAMALGLSFTGGVAMADDGRKPGYSRKKAGPQVRGYTFIKRGGYSYNYADSLDTYGSARTLFGGSRYYRDPYLDRQTSSGPFDHGFFFDSGVSPRGGDSPYMH